MLKKIFQHLFLFVIPIFILIASFFLRVASGPYWLSINSDPSYQYLINGLYLVKGVVPELVQHPGTFLQILFYGLISLLNIGRPIAEVIRNVLIDPEFYLRAMFILLSLLNFFSLTALGMYVYRKMQDKIMAILAQVPVLSLLILKSARSTDFILPVVANVSPDVLLISIVNFFNFCFLKIFFEEDKKNYFIVSCWALVSGLGLATKFTFLPLLIIPLIVLSWRKKLLFFLLFGCGFLLGTFPILSKYSVMGDWVFNLMRHSGIHGGGSVNIIDLHQFSLNWKTIFIEYFLYVFLLIIAFILVLKNILSKNFNKATLFLLASSIAIFSQFIIIAKHYGPQYFVPGIGLYSSFFVFIYLIATQGGIISRRSVILFILIFCSSLIVATAVYYRKSASLSRQVQLFHEKTCSQYSECIFIKYYRSSGIEDALAFADGWNLAPHLSKELSLLYPNKFYFNVWGHDIKNFSSRIFANDILSQSPCVLFIGSSYNFSQSPHTVRLLEKGPVESVYLLTSTTEKQSVMLFMAAGQSFFNRNYEKALVFAL